MIYEKISKDVAYKMYEGVFRKDGKTPYIEHPAAIVEMLNKWGYNDDFANSIAWLHDAIEENMMGINGRNELADYLKKYISENYKDEKISFVDLQKKIVDQVDVLTFYENDEPKTQVFQKMGLGKKFLKAKYLAEVVENSDFNGYIVKVADRLCNTRDFIKSGSNGYAKIYFTKGEHLFSFMNYWYQMAELEKNSGRIEVIKNAVKEIEKVFLEFKG